MYRKIKNGKTQKALIVLWVALLVGCVGYLAGFKNKKAASQELSPQEAAVDVQASYVRVEKAESDKVVRETIDQNMSIEAVNRVQVLPRVTGRLETLHVKAGDVVKKGQALAVLEHEQQDALIGSTQAQLASARADSERARVEMTNAKTNLDRYQRLLKEGFSTRQQYDSVETSYASAKASYNAAQAKEKQSAAELNRVKSTQQDYILYSPIDGTVLSDYSLTVGAMISPSSPIVDIADLRRLKATVRIPEIKIFAVKPGMDVIMKFDALKGREFRGKVTRVDPYVDPATRTSAVEMELDNEAVGNLLRPGMFGQASIIEKEYRNVVLVPESAIQNNSEGQYVFVENEGTARLRKVQTGLKQSNDIQITEGVTSGDRVIVFGGSRLRNGDKIVEQ